MWSVSTRIQVLIVISLGTYSPRSGADRPVCFYGTACGRTSVTVLLVLPKITGMAKYSGDDNIVICRSSISRIKRGHINQGTDRLPLWKHTDAKSGKRSITSKLISENAGIFWMQVRDYIEDRLQWLLQLVCGCFREQEDDDTYRLKPGTSILIRCNSMKRTNNKA